MTETGILGMLDEALGVHNEIRISYEPVTMTETLYTVIIKGEGNRVTTQNRNLGLAIQKATERWAVLAV